MRKKKESKPRNYVVKNALQFTRAKVEDNRKARQKRGYQKHKGNHVGSLFHLPQSKLMVVASSLLRI